MRSSSPYKRKEPPGNGTALSSGRIVPTEANPSELSGCIVGSGESSVKRNVLENNLLCFNNLTMHAEARTGPILCLLFSSNFP
jgi:hypothetical protein